MTSEDWCDQRKEPRCSLVFDVFSLHCTGQMRFLLISHSFTWCSLHHSWTVRARSWPHSDRLSMFGMSVCVCVRLSYQKCFVSFVSVGFCFKYRAFRRGVAWCLAASLHGDHWQFHIDEACKDHSLKMLSGPRLREDWVHPVHLGLFSRVS